MLPRAPAAPARRRGTPVLRRLRLTRAEGARVAIALAAGLLAGFCFPPFTLGVLVVVPLAVLQWAWRGQRAAVGAWCGFAFGVGCYALVIQWISYFGIPAYLAVIAIMAAFPALVGLVVGLFAGRGIASPLLTAATWVVAEALLGRWPFGGFPWAEVGLALHDIGVARALAGVGGVLLASFAAVALAGFLVDLAAALADRQRRSAVLAGSGVVVVLLATFVADVTRYSPQPTGELRVAVLQGDDQELSLAGQRAQQLTDDHLSLAAQLHGTYDLIVFPEGALDTDPEQDPVLREQLTDLAKQHHAALLVNARVPVNRKRFAKGLDDRIYNANLLYAPDGTLQGEYAKQHLVPFGEYVPLRGLFGNVDALRTNVPYDYTPGNKTVVFDVKGTPVGSVICFESAFGPLVRQSVRDGAQALVVSTNNRSYRRSGNTEQHLALGQLRAAETARPVVQASVSGISAVIDADGHVHDRTKLFHKAIVDTTIVTTRGETLYVRFGDWVVWACCLALVAAAVVATFRRSAGSPPRHR
ncbi:MAG: apolipoprotein N-acyltransferase [Acidimicrobiia bacterium]